MTFPSPLKNFSPVGFAAFGFAAFVLATCFLLTSASGAKATGHDDVFEPFEPFDTQERRDIPRRDVPRRAPPVMIDEGPGDDIVILGEEDEVRVDNITDRVFDFWDRYAFGNIGGFYGVGTSTSRYLFATRLGFDYPLRLSDLMANPPVDFSSRLHLEMGYGARRVEIDQELDCTSGPCPTGADDRPLERTIKVSTSDFELREAYAEFEPAPSVVVTFGRQRPIWGQFDIFSAVNLLLPIEFQSNEFGLGKQTYRMPQDSLTATWFPMARLELQGYYFLSTNLDPLYQETLEGGSNTSSDYYVRTAEVMTDTDTMDGNNGLMDAARGMHPHVTSCDDEDSAVDSDMLVRCSAGRPDTDPEEEDGIAFRALYYGTYATLGFTYHSGANSFAFTDSPLITRIRDTSDPDNPVLLAYNTLERTAVADSDSYAVEIAVPYGRWNWKAEFVYRDTEADLANVSTLRESQIESQSQSTQKRAYYDWLVDSNGASGSVPVSDIWFMSGFDADYDRWNFGLSLIYNDVAVTGRGKEAERLRKLAYPRSSSDSEIDATRFFGTGYVSYALGEEKDHILGAAGGILGPIFGATFFYNGSWRDDLDWTVSLEYQQTVSDQFLSDSNEDEDGRTNSRYEQKDGFSFGGRFGLVYRF